MSTRSGRPETFPETGQSYPCRSLSEQRSVVQATGAISPCAEVFHVLPSSRSPPEWRQELHAPSAAAHPQRRALWRTISHLPSVCAKCESLTVYAVLFFLYHGNDYNFFIRERMTFDPFIVSLNLALYSSYNNKTHAENLSIFISNLKAIFLGYIFLNGFNHFSFKSVLCFCMFCVFMWGFFLHFLIV